VTEAEDNSHTSSQTRCTFHNPWATSRVITSEAGQTDRHPATHFSKQIPYLSLTINDIRARLILPSTTTFQAKIFGFTHPNSDRPATSSRVPCTYVTRNTKDVTGPSDEPSLKPLIDSRPCLHRSFLSRVESTDNSDEDEDPKKNSHYSPPPRSPARM
jgi:hypothetical protein